MDLPSGVASHTWTCESGEERELNFMHYSLDRQTRVLFINSALLAGADTWIHLLFLRNLSQGQFSCTMQGNWDRLHRRSISCVRPGRISDGGTSVAGSVAQTDGVLANVGETSGHPVRIGQRRHR
jgi:hypothetical protein